MSSSGECRDQCAQQQPQVHVRFFCACLRIFIFIKDLIQNGKSKDICDLNLSNFCSEMGKATECTYILAAGRLCVCERESIRRDVLTHGGEIDRDRQ